MQRNQNFLGKKNKKQQVTIEQAKDVRMTEESTTRERKPNTLKMSVRSEDILQKVSKNEFAQLGHRQDITMQVSEQIEAGSISGVSSQMPRNSNVEMSQSSDQESVNLPNYSAIFQPKARELCGSNLGLLMSENILSYLPAGNNMISTWLLEVRNSEELKDYTRRNLKYDVGKNEFFSSEEDLKNFWSRQGKLRNDFILAKTTFLEFVLQQCESIFHSWCQRDIAKINEVSTFNGKINVPNLQSCDFSSIRFTNFVENLVRSPQFLSLLENQGPLFVDQIILQYLGRVAIIQDRHYRQRQGRCCADFQKWTVERGELEDEAETIRVIADGIFNGFFWVKQKLGQLGDSDSYIPLDQLLVIWPHLRSLYREEITHDDVLIAKFTHGTTWQGAKFNQLFFEDFSLMFSHPDINKYGSLNFDEKSAIWQTILVIMKAEYCATCAQSQDAKRIQDFETEIPQSEYYLRQLYIFQRQGNLVKDFCSYYHSQEILAQDRFHHLLEALDMQTAFQSEYISLMKVVTDGKFNNILDDFDKLKILPRDSDLHYLFNAQMIFLKAQKYSLTNDEQQFQNVPELQDPVRMQEVQVDDPMQSNDGVSDSVPTKNQEDSQKLGDKSPNQMTENNSELTQQSQQNTQPIQKSEAQIQAEEEMEEQLGKKQDNQENSDRTQQMATELSKQDPNTNPIKVIPVHSQGNQSLTPTHSEKIQNTSVKKVAPEHQEGNWITARIQDKSMLDRLKELKSLDKDQIREMLLESQLRITLTEIVPVVKSKVPIKQNSYQNVLPFCKRPKIKKETNLVLVWRRSKLKEFSQSMGKSDLASYQRDKEEREEEDKREQIALKITQNSERINEILENCLFSLGDEQDEETQELRELRELIKKAQEHNRDNLMAQSELNVRTYLMAPISKVRSARFQSTNKR